MNILLIGGGGREHTFAWKIKQSPLCNKLFIAPGNAGTAELGTNLDISVSDFVSLAAAALTHKIDLIMVGPEEPLVKGIADFFQKGHLTAHIKIIGPCKEAAQLEGSKAFAKDFMLRHGIPTAAYREFTEENYEDGVAYLQQHSLPVVLKADGLAAGKGVLICETHIEALAEFDLMIHRAKFGDAGKKVVVEEFLQGIEMSVFVLTDGKSYINLPSAKDYKRIGEGDTGLNTGGMGAISPVPILDDALTQKITADIIEPTIKGLTADKLEYCGFVFIGLMVNDGEPFVIEYNCRMGDPETEVVLPRIKNDLLEMLIACAEKKLDSITPDIDPQTAAAIVAVSGGYPGLHETGFPILGLENPVIPGSLLFHAGTCFSNNEVVTKGGRVLVSVSLAEDLRDATEQSEYALQQIEFEGMYYRGDIGFEFK